MQFHVILDWLITAADCIVFNILRQTQNGRHFPEDIFKCTFWNEIAQISIDISVKFTPKGQINNISALVQIMAWSQPSNKRLSEPMMVTLLLKNRWIFSLMGELCGVYCFYFAQMFALSRTYYSDCCHVYEVWGTHWERTNRDEYFACILYTK